MKVRNLKAKHLGHVIMVVFAGASLFNISDFIYTLHPNEFLAWTVAIALAASLVVFSALLAEMKWRSTGFYIMLAVVAGLTAISGAIQGGAYSRSVGWSGWAMGFAMPLFGELGASLALSVYAREQQARSMDEAQKQLSDGVRRNIIEALGNVDRSKIEVQVNRAIGVITRELIDSAIHDMIGELREHRQISQFAISEPAQITEIATEKPEKSENLHEVDDPIAKMNAAKRAKILQRQQMILQLIDGEGLPLEELAQRAECSTRTIRNDLDALMSAGHAMSINGVVKLAH